MRRNLSNDFEATNGTRARPFFSLDQQLADLTDGFNDATRLDVHTEWKKNMKRRHSPSPPEAVESPFRQAGIPTMPSGFPDTSAGGAQSSGQVLSSGQMVYQEGLRKQIESKMANLATCQRNLTCALEEEGYQVSDGGDIEVQLYDQRNMMASTDPELLSRDYGQRIQIMDDINLKLAVQLKMKKEKLSMFLANMRLPPSSQSEPRRSLRLRGKKSNNKREDYYYY